MPKNTKTWGSKYLTFEDILEEVRGIASQIHNESYATKENGFDDPYTPKDLKRLEIMRGYAGLLRASLENFIDGFFDEEKK